MKVEISNQCFKVDKPNYVALTAGVLIKEQSILDNIGFPEEKKVRQAIWCSIDNFGLPKLIVCQKELNKWQPLNDKFKRMDNGLPELPYNHIAFLEKDYFIGTNWDNKKMWKEICSNGLFNIWKPIAPENRFWVRTHYSCYRISLLRVYKIHEEFNVNDIELGCYSNANIKDVSQSISVTIEKPVISDEKFLKIKSLLEKTLNKYN